METEEEVTAVAQEEGIEAQEQGEGEEEITPRVDEGIGQQGLTPWVVVAIVLGAAAISAAVAFGVVVLVRRRRGAKTKAPPIPPQFALENPHLLPQSG